MLSETNKDYELTIKDTTENFNTSIQKEYISEILKQELTKASILIVPTENLNDIPVFSRDSEDFLLFIKINLPPEYSIDICIDELDYKELSSENFQISIGPLVVFPAVCSILANLISKYIEEEWKYIKINADIKVSFIITDNNFSKQITYKGLFKNYQYFTQWMKNIEEKAKENPTIQLETLFNISL